MKRWAAIARLGSIGDNLVSGSPLRMLKKLGYNTEVICTPPAHVVYHHNPYIDKLTVKKDEHFPKDDPAGWQLYFAARAAEYDLFIHATHSLEGRHSVFRHMTQFWWPPEYRRRICAGSFLETAHDIANVPYDFGPLYFSSPEERKNALTVKSKMGTRFALWVISGTRLDKGYPYAPHAISRLIKELNIPVLIMGGPTDKERAMAKTIKDEVIRTNGDSDDLHIAIPENSGDRSYPLRSSLCLAQVADLVISPDTGIAWAVALEPMPKIILLSHGSVENVTKHWLNTTTLHADPDRVPCWPCHRLHDDPSTCVLNRESNGAACISDISVETIVQAAASAWRTGAPDPGSISTMAHSLAGSIWRS